ncbi:MULTISPECIES: glycosyltransferase [unclassified Exiguobacterium]|uniref:glycosyltransferase n=1 Tax=unclassified Exiguobacterium TaxID=2644629 RepID=UPI0013761222|nr:MULTISPECIES: glycosyltransferase [unclassified Exiguobacterium]
MVADILLMTQEERQYQLIYCSPDGDIKKDLEYRGLSYFPLKKLSYFEVKEAVKVIKPDLIHTHDVKTTIIASLLYGNIPIIAHLHGNPKDMRRIGMKSVMFLWASRKVKKIIAVSKSVIEDYYFKENIADKTIILSNVVFPDRLEKLSKKDNTNFKFDFIFLGRLSYPKDPERVAEVASIVLKRNPHTTFGIIGDGELKSSMKKIFDKNNVIDRVTFTGKLSFPYKVLQDSKCMLMCSEFEGTPIAALEAMALGVPIVSTPVDGMKSLVFHEKTGILSNSNSTLATSVENIINDCSLNKQMKLNIEKEFSNINDVKQYKQQILNIYDKLIKT